VSEKYPRETVKIHLNSASLTRYAHISPEIPLIIYLSEQLDYKDYCRKGKSNQVLPPDTCPVCGSMCCFIGRNDYSGSGMCNGCF